LDGGRTRGNPLGEAARFPFLFYGHHPEEWAEGHAYKVRFVTAPDEAARQAAIAALAKAAERTQIDLGPSSWKWDGAWASVAFYEGPAGDDEEWDGKTDYGQLFRDISRAFESVHAVAPLAEVISMNARAYSGTDAWGKWTLRMQPRPSKSPSLGGLRGLLFEE
jgi:hypothetical protein